MILCDETDRAIELLQTRHFHNWEGSSDLRTTYLDAYLTRGTQRLESGKPREALADFEAALQYPPNLEVGKPRREPRLIEVHYRIASACDVLNEDARAKEHYETAAALADGPGTANRYFQGLALRKLGRGAEADPLFADLVRINREKLQASPAVDYFAKFGERQSERSRQAQFHYLIGLGLEGQGKVDEARSEWQQALERDPTHLGAHNLLAAPAAR
jgi:tetratricopeptide (TPR) repeat protein